MINNLQISGVHSHLSDKERAYVRKKIGGLDKYIPKKARESTFVEVKIKQKNAKNKQIYQCEVIIKLPKQTITAHKNSTTILAAIDETEDNLKNQLKKYKDMHAESRITKHFSGRVKNVKQSILANNLY